MIALQAGPQQQTAPQALGEDVPTRFVVNFRRIDVTKIADPGRNAEVEFTVTVNHKTLIYENKNLPLGSTKLGLCLPVDVAGVGAIAVVVSGIEKDVTSGVDRLPGFSRIFGEAQGFGVGLRSVSASNEHISYTMVFQIEPTGNLDPCAPPSGGGGGGGGRPPDPPVDEQ